MATSEENVVMPPSKGVAREGYPFIAVAIALSILLWLVAGWVAGAVSLILPVFVTSFFRDPHRVPACDPQDASILVSPADGRVLSVAEVSEDRFLNHRMLRVCIFMSVFNVHVNRVPCSGRVKTIHYLPGRFLIGYAEKASLDNEQNAIVMEHPSGRDILLIQIAGLVARRIICYLKGGETVSRGERFGLIRFGSRVDVYVPVGSEVLVREGARVRAGQTPLVRLKEASS